MIRLNAFKRKKAHIHVMNLNEFTSLPKGIIGTEGKKSQAEKYLPGQTFCLHFNYKIK